MTIRETLTAASPEIRSSPSDYLLPDDVVLVVAGDGSGRLLDLAGNFYALTASAAGMLYETLLVGSDHAARRISRQYRADPEHVAADLRGFLAGLVENRLVCPRAQVARARRKPPAVRGWVVGLALRLACATVAALRWPVGGRSRFLLSLAHVSLRVLGWPGTVDVWRRFGGRSGRRLQPDGLAESVDAAVRAAAATHLLNVECKERGLVCWSLLRSQGLPAELVLGIDLFPFASHAWCRLGSRVVGDFPDRCDRFTPVLTYR